MKIKEENEGLVVLEITHMCVCAYIVWFMFSMANIDNYNANCSNTHINIFLLLLNEI